MSAKLIYLEEFKLKRDLTEVQELLDRVKYLISIGLDVPQETIDDLLLWEMELEQLLEKYENLD